jgi:anti-sigma B factor antagonist
MTSEDGCVTATLRGEIDFTNSDEIGAHLRDLVAEGSPLMLRVDLKEATFIDSTGLGALLEGYQAAIEADCAFTVVNPSLTFRRVLTVTGLTEIFGLDDVADHEETNSDLVI